MSSGVESSDSKVRGCTELYTTLLCIFLALCCIFSSTPDGEVSRDKKVDERRGSEFGKIRFCAAYQTYWTRKTNFYFNFKVLLPLLTIHKSIFASCRNHIEMPKKLPH